ncbi:acyl-CoA thioesterase [Nocardioides stalactiti]|uniref:acyl-CoA thioesterase n=1 Tax=Nocardioides stalactiti TaxID=2755356 RepID=UPI001603F5B4|nr:thioesterase family protein [Nocardioides stalactiti]
MSDDAHVADLLADYPVVVEIPVAWGDMDAMGHVNNTVYFRYFETARIRCFEALSDGAAGDPSAEGSGVGPIVHTASCRFRIPLTYPDTVTVGVRIGEISEDRYVMHSRAVSHRHGAVAAEGETLVVAFDYATGTKTPIPDGLRTQLLGLRGGV